MGKQLIFDFYRTLYNPKTKTCYAGCKTLLLNVKSGYTLVLVTTSGKNRLSQIFLCGIDSFFDKIIVCKRKTFSDFRSITNSSNSIVIGDNFKEEIFFARKLGLENIMVNDQKENPIKTIKTFLQKKGNV